MKKYSETLVPISLGMTSNSQNYIQLQHILKTEFKINKQWKKKLPKLLINLISVNEGIKPSYLWDIGIKQDITHINYVISVLKVKNLINKNICVINIGEDTFISNLDAVREMYNHFNSSYKFIDCSSCLDKPVCIDDMNLENLKKSFDYLIEKMSTFSCSSNVDTKHLVLEEGNEKDCCYPTLFGILLGYPVVYWSNTVNNCLSDIDLCIYKVSIKTINIIPCDWSEIYSFSVPEHLNLPNYINSWFEKLQLKCDYSLKLDQVVTCAEHIVL